MQNHNMYPPGRVLWGMRDGDLHPSHQLHSLVERGEGVDPKDKLRLFEVLDVEKVFPQIVFSRNMLMSFNFLCIHTQPITNLMTISAHMPHQYDQVLHDLL